MFSLYYIFYLDFSELSYRVFLWQYLWIYCYSIISEAHEYIRILLIDWLRIWFYFKKFSPREEIGMFRGQIEFIRFSFLSELLQDTSSSIKIYKIHLAEWKRFFNFLGYTPLALKLYYNNYLSKASWILLYIYYYSPRF